MLLDTQISEEGGGEEEREGGGEEEREVERKTFTPEEHAPAPEDVATKETSAKEMAESKDREKDPDIHKYIHTYITYTCVYQYGCVGPPKLVFLTSHSHPPSLCPH